MGYYHPLSGQTRLDSEPKRSTLSNGRGRRWLCVRHDQERGSFGGHARSAFTPAPPPCALKFERVHGIKARDPGPRRSCGST